MIKQDLIEFYKKYLKLIYFLDNHKKHPRKEDAKM